MSVDACCLLNYLGSEQLNARPSIQSLSIAISVYLRHINEAGETDKTDKKDKTDHVLITEKESK